MYACLYVRMYVYCRLTMRRANGDLGVAALREAAARGLPPALVGQIWQALLGALVWTLFTAGVDMVVSPKIPHLSWPGCTKSSIRVLKSRNVGPTFPQNLDWEGRRSPLHTVKGISNL